MSGKFSSKCYQSLLRYFQLLPRRLSNDIVLFIRFTRLPHSKFYTDLKYIGNFKVKTGKGFFKLYSSGGTIENEIFWKGLDHALEPETIWVWKLLSRQAKTVIDIGANTGIYSLLAKSINPDCEVCGFEPSRDTYKQFVKNIEANKFDIKPFEIAVSDNEADSIFYDVFDAHQTSASLSPQKLKDNPGFTGAINEYVVKTTSLDKFVTESRLDTVDLIKVDVELHEPEVFAGMKETMSTYKPVIIFEVLIHEVADKLNAFFYQKNYILFHLETTANGNYILAETDKLIGKINFDWNYLACPIEKIPLLKEIGVL